MWKGLIERYRKYLPVSDATPVVTLQEGNTPLLRLSRLEREMKLDVEVYAKYEGANPTGSFKDRGMTLAVSKALEEGSKAVICASTGNTSASAAAYAARAGLRCTVVLPEGKIARGKLAQAMMHGAQIIPIKGNFDAALEIVKEISARYPVTLVNSLNPYRIEGQKTGAFEICDQLGGRAPDFHLIPVGNAGNITAYWQGYVEYKAAKEIDDLPVMLGFQAAGAAPIVLGRPVPNPETVATAIRIGNPASWKRAEAAARESGGAIDAVTDEEILRAYRLVAQLEGLFAEPASGASVAGLLKLQESGYWTEARRRLKGRLPVAVCILTGHGLKDPETAVSQIGEPVALPASVESVAAEMGLEERL